MIMEIYVKNGTGGYYDEGNCDMLVKKLSTDIRPIPRIGESIDILEDNDTKRTNSNGVILREYHQYLVTDVRYQIADDVICSRISVYVVPIGRCIP